MLVNMLTRLTDWWAYHQTYAALRQLHPILLRDLGLADIDLRRISRRAARQREPISVYQLANEYFDEDIRRAVRLKLPARAACEDDAVSGRYAGACS